MQSTMTENQLDETYIPGDDEVVANSKRRTWRFASGVICTGSAEAGTYIAREHNKLTGRLRRVGITDVTYQKKEGDRRVFQVEADIETKGGLERIAASLCDLDGTPKPSGVAISFTWALLQIAKDELCIFSAALGTKKNKFNKYPTFVNAFTLPPGKVQGVPIPNRKHVEDETMETAVEKLLAELRMHPAFADRPAHESDDEDGSPNTHLSALCKECQEYGWPTPEQSVPEWLTLLAKLFPDAAPSSLGDMTEDDWGTVRQSVGAWVAKQVAEHGAGTYVHPLLQKKAVGALD